MFAGGYFAAVWYAGVLMPVEQDTFQPWFAMSANKVVGWRIQQV